MAGPVRLPYIASNGTPKRNQIGGSFNKIGSHHYSISESSNYAVGIGKTTSTNNLKATVSGGNFYVSGDASHEDREIIKFKCSPTGNIAKISPTKAVSEAEPRYNQYYQKFRQQNKIAVKEESKYSSTKNLSKNKFPLPFTGIEYPLIDGGGITSWGRDGIYSNNKPIVKIYNDFEKSWLYSLPDKYSLSANERPTYGKKKTKLENKSNKIVYDCLNSSPYYTSVYQAEHSSMIDLNREYILDSNNGLEDQKAKTTGLIQRKDRYYSYLLPYYALEDEFDNTLIFESRFESGNLRRAFK